MADLDDLFDVRRGEVTQAEALEATFLVEVVDGGEGFGEGGGGVGGVEEVGFYAGDVESLRGKLAFGGGENGVAGERVGLPANGFGVDCEVFGRIQFAESFFAFVLFIHGISILSCS